MESGMGSVPLQTISGWVASGGMRDLGLGFVLAGLTFPLMVIVHEAGHAAVGLLRTEGLVVLRVGRSPGWVEGRVGRLAFEVSPLRSRDRLAGWARTFARMTRGESVAYAVAGAAAQLLVLVVSVPLIGRTSGAVHSALVWAWAVHFLNTCLNLAPMRVGGHMSDGACLLAAVRARPVDSSHRPPAESTADAFIGEFVDTMSRCRSGLSREQRRRAEGIPGSRLRGARPTSGFPRAARPGPPLLLPVRRGPARRRAFVLVLNGRP
jgi:hypothetical protein